jgi:hypothetical protein
MTTAGASRARNSANHNGEAAEESTSNRDAAQGMRWRMGDDQRVISVVKIASGERLTARQENANFDPRALLPIGVASTQIVTVPIGSSRVAAR